MKQKILIFSTILLCSLFVFAQEPIDLKEAEKMADANVKAIQKDGIKKIMFVEFFGEFITSKETAPSTMSSRWGGAMGSKTLVQQVEVSDDYYENVTNEMYDLVKQIFIDNGIEVLDKETLINNPDYIELGLKEERGTRAYSGGITKQSVTTEGVKRSVSGMGMFSETLKIGAVMKIKKMVPKMANDNDCQAAITVRFKFGLGKNNVPTLDYINMTMDSNIGSSGSGKSEMFYFKKGAVPIFTTKKGITCSNDFDEGGGKLNADKYHESMIDAVKTLTGAYSVILKDNLQ